LCLEEWALPFKLAEQPWSKLGMVVHTYNSSIQEAKIGGSQVPGQPSRCSEPLIQKTKEKKNAMF
jgi:hypothetical protein